MAESSRQRGMAEGVLPRAFYLGNTLEVARKLLGKVLVHDAPAGRTAGRIVEVEAYIGPEDRAAHSFGGRRTARNQIMYAPGGHAYVYFIYGMHFCFNVVTGPQGCPEAVLVRGLEPLEGIDLMRRRRRVDARYPVFTLARGPGNLCRAMGINRKLDGCDLRTGPLRILSADPVPAEMISATPRIGVAYAGEDARRPWRLFIAGNPCVSGTPRSVPKIDK